MPLLHAAEAHAIAVLLARARERHNSRARHSIAGDCRPSPDEQNIVHVERKAAEPAPRDTMRRPAVGRDRLSRTKILPALGLPAPIPCAAG